MDIILKFSLVILLALIAYEDIRSRQIRLVLLILSFITLLGYLSTQFSADMLLQRSFFNLVYIMFLCLCIILYISFKHRRPNFNLNRYLGTGDILFWIILVPYFDLILFALFFVISLLVSLFLHMVFTKKNELIPLAGYQSICFIFYLILEPYLSIGFSYNIFF